MKSLLGHRYAPWFAVAVGLLLVAPSLDDQLVLDDHVLMLQQRGAPEPAGLEHRPLDLFTFTTGDASSNRDMMHEGVLLPWWTHPELRIAFLRPVSSLTHLLDGTLWPDSPVWMHVHSILWWGLLLLCMFTLYRKWLAPRWIAVLGLVLFAVDDAHGATVAWIANRNALVSLTLALPVLHLHDRHHRTGSATALVAASLLFAVAMLAGETALAVLGYVGAHALWLDRRGLAPRAASLLPYVGVVVLWRLLYMGLGYGARGSGAYHDPGREPLAFFEALLHNLPLLVGSQMGLPLADLGFWGADALAPVLLSVSLATLALIAWLSWDLLRTSETARFWATGMVLAAVPVSASLPGERLLLGVGVGGSAFVALLLAALSDRVRRAAPNARGARAGVVGLVTLHLVLAPFLLPVRAGSMAVLGDALDRAGRGVPATRDVRDRTVVIVQTPLDIFASYIQVRRAQRGIPRPAHLHWLATAGTPLTVTRTGVRKLRITADAGMLSTHPERHYRSLALRFRRGDWVQMPGWTAVVQDVTADGRPRAVDFVFDAPLDSPQYVWRTFRDGRFVPFSPPPSGGSARFPAQDLYEVLAPW